MQSAPHHLFHLLLLLAPVLAAGGRADPARIELIELFQENQVLIHFDTEANLTYELQFSEALATDGLPEGTWTNLFVAPAIPFPNHYVVVDTQSGQQRFYRLHLIPEATR